MENIARKQLNPYEEAKAVRAMLDRGLDWTGAAQALGWPKACVSARMKLLELPERAQQMIGDGTIALSAVDQLRAIGTVAPKLLEAVIAYLDDGNAWAAERLAREPGWVLDAALATVDDTGACSPPTCTAPTHTRSPGCGWARSEQLYAECERLHRQLDRYAYGPPPVRFTEEDVDRARAAGVLIEFDSGRPIIVDRSLYRELVKAAIKRTHSELESKAAAAAEHKKTQRRPAGGSGRGRQARARRATARPRRSGARRRRRPRHGTDLPPGRGRSRRPDGGAVLRLRAARGRSRPLALHADRRADRPPGPPTAFGWSSRSCAAT